ncbi:MAG TPA: circadian clock KaiB family protein [Bacteroidales bacterium]|jgi:circadian clock protein KaiB|nr:circadian clock KaiB family protein [Bacteroidales bacterium]
MRRKIIQEDSAAKYEEQLNRKIGEQYLLKLYVSGSSPQSIRAIYNLKKICEEKLKGRYILEIIDLYQKPEVAKEVNLIAAPTLIKRLPLPIRRVIGDMSNADRVLVGLDVSKVDNE